MVTSFQNLRPGGSVAVVVGFGVVVTGAGVVRGLASGGCNSHASVCRNSN